MKKKTIAIVSLSLILAIIAIVVIAKIPRYNIEQELGEVKNPVIQSGGIDIEENTRPTGPEVQGEDTFYLDETGENGIELLPPSLDNNDVPEEINELQTVAKINSAMLKAELGLFLDTDEVKLKKLGMFSEDYHRADYLMKDYAEKFAAYKYTATRDGKDYNAIGRVKLIINIPKSYDIDKVSVCYLFDDHVQELNCYINKNNRTAIVSATSTGVYMLVEEKPVTDKPSDDNTSSDDTSSNTSSDGTSSTVPEGDPDSMEGWSPWF